VIFLLNRKFGFFFVSWPNSGWSNSSFGKVLGPWQHYLKIWCPRVPPYGWAIQLKHALGLRDYQRVQTSCSLPHWKLNTVGRLLKNMHALVAALCLMRLAYCILFTQLFMPQLISDSEFSGMRRNGFKFFLGWKLVRVRKNHCWPIYESVLYDSLYLNHLHLYSNAVLFGSYIYIIHRCRVASIARTPSVWYEFRLSVNSFEVRTRTVRKPQIMMYYRHRGKLALKFIPCHFPCASI